MVLGANYHLLGAKNILIITASQRNSQLASGISAYLDIHQKKVSFFLWDVWRSLETPTMVLSVEIASWHDTDESTTPTTRPGGGDRSF